MTGLGLQSKGAVRLRPWEAVGSARAVNRMAWSPARTHSKQTKGLEAETNHKLSTGICALVPPGGFSLLRIVDGGDKAQLAGWKAALQSQSRQPLRPGGFCTFWFQAGTPCRWHTAKCGRTAFSEDKEETGRSAGL